MIDPTIPPDLSAIIDGLLSRIEKLEQSPRSDQLSIDPEGGLTLLDGSGNPIFRADTSGIATADSAGQDRFAAGAAGVQTFDSAGQVLWDSTLAPTGWLMPSVFGGSASANSTTLVEATGTYTYWTTADRVSIPLSFNGGSDGDSYDIQLVHRAVFGQAFVDTVLDTVTAAGQTFGNERFANFTDVDISTITGLPIRLVIKIKRTTGTGTGTVSPIFPAMFWGS